jgi:hypothetical protein
MMLVTFDAGDLPRSEMFILLLIATIVCVKAVHAARTNPEKAMWLLPAIGGIIFLTTAWMKYIQQLLG